MVSLKQLKVFLVSEMITDHIVMQEEIDTAMRLLGVTRIDQLGPEYVSSFVGGSLMSFS